MVNFLICLSMSVSLSYGMAILLVEKGKEWPIRPWRIRLQLLLSKIHWKLPQMLFCSSCCSFWSSLGADIVICIVALCFGVPYFFWPFSGIITAGIMWSIVEYLNALDKNQDINVFIDRGDNDEN